MPSAKWRCSFILFLLSSLVVLYTLMTPFDNDDFVFFFFIICTTIMNFTS